MTNTGILPTRRRERDAENLLQTTVGISFKRFQVAGINEGFQGKSYKNVSKNKYLLHFIA